MPAVKMVKRVYEAADVEGGGAVYQCGLRRQKAGLSPQGVQND